jgi:hypothetical protein
MLLECLASKNVLVSISPDIVTFLFTRKFYQFLKFLSPISSSLNWTQTFLPNVTFLYLVF